MPTHPAQENLYIQRINAVIGYVRENLKDDLPLNNLARVAGFSPFHFHRLFKLLTGETVNEMVVRLRLERAVALLRSTPTLSITEAAVECGFKSVSVFSRTFKKRYSLKARQWDRQSPLKNSKNGQVLASFTSYTGKNLIDFAERDGLRVRLFSLPAQRLAYIRVYDSYSKFSRVKEAYERLMAWYCQRGGKLENTTLYGMSQDDPDVTCQVAAIRCLGDLQRADRAIQYLFRYWLPRSRYQPANLPGMEIYRRQPAELGWETFDLDCAVPIVAL